MLVITNKRRCVFLVPVTGGADAAGAGTLDAAAELAAATPVTLPDAAPLGCSIRGITIATAYKEVTLLANVLNYLS